MDFSGNIFVTEINSFYWRLSSLIASGNVHQCMHSFGSAFTGKYLHWQWMKSPTETTGYLQYRDLIFCKICYSSVPVKTGKQASLKNTVSNVIPLLSLPLLSLLIFFCVVVWNWSLIASSCDVCFETDYIPQQIGLNFSKYEIASHLPFSQYWLYVILILKIINVFIRMLYPYASVHAIVSMLTQITSRLCRP